MSSTTKSRRASTKKPSPAASKVSPPDGKKMSPDHPDGVQSHSSPLTERHYIMHDPYDLAMPERIIWDAIQAELADMGPDEKLVILASKTPDVAAHNFINAATVNRLASWKGAKPKDTSRHFAIAVAGPANTLSQYAMTQAGLEIHPAFEHRPDLLDPDGALSTKAALVQEFDKDEDPLSSDYFYDACLASGAPIRFIDCTVESDGKRKINGRDDFVNTIASKDFQQSVGNRSLNADSPRGISIRNAVMVERGLDVLAQTDSRILVQECESDQVLGSNDNKESRDNSLARLYRSKAEKRGESIRTLGVVYSDNGRQVDISRRTSRWYPHYVVLDAVDPTQFPEESKRPESRRESFQGVFSRIAGMAGEKAHIDTLARSYGGDKEPLFRKPSDTIDRDELSTRIADAHKQAELRYPELTAE